MIIEKHGVKTKYYVREVELWIDGWTQTQASTLAHLHIHTHTIIGRSDEAVVTSDLNQPQKPMIFSN